MVDRLAMIEGDLRRVQSAPEPRAIAQPAPYAPAAAIRPELSNPVQPQMSDVRIQPPLLLRPRCSATKRRRLCRVAADPQRQPIDPNLPPDFPLEPGGARNRAEAIAAADIGLGHDAAPPAEGSGQSNFIAAARRAAQAAAAATNEKPSRVTALTEAARNAAAKATAKVTAAGADATDTSAKSSRVRSILVGLSVVVIVIGAFKMALTFLDSGDHSPAQTIEKSAAAPTSIMPPPATLPAPAPRRRSPQAFRC